MLVYDRAPEELIGTASCRRSDHDSAYQRFARMPAETLFAVLSELVDLHRVLAAANWVACDLDNFQRGPFTNTIGRMLGSTRFMAPEEFELGATIDERTAVYTLARLAWHFGTRLTEDAAQFCGPMRLQATLERALHVDLDQRFGDVDTFGQAWAAA